MKRFFVRLVTIALTMYVLPLADYVVSWFGDIASVAHAASCSVSTLCGSLGARGTSATTVAEGDIITCVVGNSQYQDKKCFGSGGIIVTPIYTSTSVDEKPNTTYMKIDDSQFSSYTTCEAVTGG